MEYLKQIEKAVSYIESNIYEDLSIDRLAGLVHCSKFHYHRIFHAIVGCPIMEYIRKRRITIAADLLLNTNKRIIDIAAECGFNSQAAFNRAFVTVTGITPGEYRRGLYNIILYEPVHPSECRMENPKKSYILGPKLITLRKKNIIGMTCTTTYDDNINKKDIPCLWEKFLSRLEEIHNKVDPDINYGIVIEGNSNSQIRFMVCTEVENLEVIPNGMTSRIIDECKYASFTYKGIVDLKKVFGMYDYIYGNWLLNSEYLLEANGNFIEIMSDRFTNTESSEYEICLPIK